MIFVPRASTPTPSRADLRRFAMGDVVGGAATRAGGDSR